MAWNLLGILSLPLSLSAPPLLMCVHGLSLSLSLKEVNLRKRYILCLGGDNQNKAAILYLKVNKIDFLLMIANKGYNSFNILFIFPLATVIHAI